MRESQIDDIVETEIRTLHDEIIAESKRYDRIVKDWLKKKPLYDRQIQTHTEKIRLCQEEIEQLIIECINDRTHASVYNNMIEKRETEIQNLENKIEELHHFDEVCKKRRDELKNTSDLIDNILDEGHISNVNLRMLVKQVTVHQNEDRSIDIRFDINGNFQNDSMIEIEPEL